MRILCPDIRYPPVEEKYAAMPDRGNVLLTGFADEAAINKTAVEQFVAFAALGLQFYSIRFIDAGNGIKNVMDLEPTEIQHILKLQADYGLQVSSIGSPIGKVKLLDVDDGTKNRFVPFDEYLANDVPRACSMANSFGTKLIRGFSFYPPKQDDPEQHLPQVVDQLGQIADVCEKAGTIFGLEIEANLTGRTGQLMAKLYEQVNHPSLVLIFDAANVLCQGYTPAELFEQYQAMKPGLAWLHIKDYLPPEPRTEKGYVDEEAIKHFVPADMGGSGHEAILRDFKRMLPELTEKLRLRGLPGVFMDLEPHVKGGGQFGGFSGPDGMGVAMRSLCNLLDYVGIGYQLREFSDIQAARGF